MPDYRKFYDKNYIGAWDLEKGDATLTIEKVEQGELESEGGRKTRKPVISFTGAKKKFAVNVTNGKIIASLYGTDTTKWIGKPITLYPTTTNFGKELRDAVRVRPQVPQQQTKGAA